MHLHRDKKYKYTEDLAMDDFSSFSHFHATLTDLCKQFVQYFDGCCLSPKCIPKRPLQNFFSTLLDDELTTKNGKSYFFCTKNNVFSITVVFN